MANMATEDSTVSSSNKLFWYLQRILHDFSKDHASLKPTVPLSLRSLSQVFHLLKPTSKLACTKDLGLLKISYGINIRNGRFLLRSFQSILTSATLTEYEEALNQGSMTASEVFINLRSKSILHLFASFGRFLGLEVYEQGFSIVKVPKTLLNGSTMLIMGFPDCGSSYFLLVQLDKDFKPLFKLLETRPDPSTKGLSSNDSNHVIHMKKIDVSQMQLFEDVLNLSLLDWGKLAGSLPAGVSNQSSEHGLLSEFSLEGPMQIAGYPLSSFSSVVDEVFELEKGASAPSFPLQNLKSYNASAASRFGSVPMNLQTAKTGTPSPKWEGGLQVSQMNNFVKVSSAGSHYNGLLHPSSNLKGSTHSNLFSSLSSGLGRGTTVKKLSASKSDQDLASLRSPHSVEVGSNSSVDEDHLRLLNDTSMDALSGSRSSRLLSPSHSTGSRSSTPGVGLRSSPTGPVAASVRVTGSSSLATTPVSQAAGDAAVFQGAGHNVSKREKDPRKRTVSDMLNLIPSLQDIDSKAGISKSRRTSESAFFQQHSSHMLISSEMIFKNEGYSYGNLIAEANKGNAPSSIYVSALLHVVRHCSVCIKHARLTSQMDALEIPYVEEVGLRNASSNIWFRLPLARGDSWQHICLRLGRPGSMY
ncbi:mediator of RNA polymerase II transcription subunit 14 [Hevea brasiliensis]|uniref:mediator of RNA polymerase II transcription subunit 14 n=1 Tax=Hevea brasiliensis TaxID=3981 RepID=UPI0025FF1644|nr:mediator of RNA polymerase II transcription subunit 14 [Hevea brasiliensis]